MTQVLPFKLVKLETRMATEDDSHLPTYDHTKLAAINTCPTWGIIRYSRHLRMPGDTRAMALEAGAAAHEAFSAVRWFQYGQVQANTTIESRIAENQGVRIFGQERFDQLKSTLDKSATERTNVINFALEALYTSGYYDDPSDTKRTISNISESLIAYIDRWDMERYPIWVRDSEDPKSDIGIEIAFDVVATFTLSDGTTEIERTYRFTGKLDGLHWNRDKLLVMEDKTGARLDNAWLAQWILSHQITGYCVAGHTFTGLDCMIPEAKVLGMKIPLGRIAYEGIRQEDVKRNVLMVSKWAEWFVSTVEMEQTFRKNVLDAPMFTTACNRYFRSCSFLPLCACNTVEDKQQVLEEMQLDEWSPLHE